MVEEVEKLLGSGLSPERLARYGLDNPARKFTCAYEGEGGKRVQVQVKG